jgi:hypothetical protein
MPIVRMPDGRKVRFPDDMPREQIKSIVAQKYPDAYNGSAKKGLQLTDEQKAKIKEERDNYNKKGTERGLKFIADALMGFGEGVESGFNRLNNAATLGGYDWVDRNYLDNTVGKKQQALRNLAEAEGAGGALTAANLATDIGGAGFGGAGKIATKISNAGIKGLKSLALNNTATGTIFGATSSDRLEDLPSNIVGNAVLANILGFGAYGLGKGGKFIYDTAMPYANAESSAIKKAIDSVGLGKLKDFAQKASEKSRNILEIGDDNIVNLSQEARQKSPRAYSNFEKAVDAFKEGQNARNSEIINESFGNRGKYESTDDLIRVAKEQASPLYEKLQSVGDLANINKNIKNVAKNPFLRKEIGNVLSDPLYQAEYGAGKMSPTDWRVLDQTNRSINDKISAAIRAGETDKVRLLERQKYELLNQVDNIVPEYKLARGIYEAEGKALKAQKIGEDSLFDRNTSAEKLSRKMKDMTDYEKQSLRIGAREKLLNTIEGTENQALALKKLNNKQTQDKVKVVLGDKADKFIKYAADEVKAMRNINKLTGNSNTAEKQSLRDKMSLFQRISKNPLGASGEIADVLSSRINNARDDVLSQMLLEKGAGSLQKGIKDYIARENAAKLRGLLPRTTGVIANEILKID